MHALTDAILCGCQSCRVIVSTLFTSSVLFRASHHTVHPVGAAQDVIDASAEALLLPLVLRLVNDPAST